MKECNEVTVYHYCSECYTTLTKAMKHCTNKKCHGKVCDLAVLDIERRIKQLYRKCTIYNEDLYNNIYFL